MNWYAILAEIISTGVIVGAIVYWFTAYSQGSSRAQQDLNSTLNELLKARDTKIGDLEEMVKEQGKQIAHLQGQVETLTKKKIDMEELILKALTTYFTQNPDIALKLHSDTK